MRTYEQDIKILMQKAYDLLPPRDMVASRFENYLNRIVIAND